MSPKSSPLEALRRLPRDPASFYAISDAELARPLGGFLWIFGAIVIALILPFAPPTQHIGDAGWAVGATVVMVSLASAVPLLRWPERVSPDALLVMSFLAIGAITVMVWVGGHPYGAVFMIPALYASAVHPPQRVLAVYVMLTAGLAAPLAYDGWSAQLAGETLAELLMWLSLGMATLLFTATLRLERVELLAEEQEASSLARLDPLTGLGNRRAFDEALDQVVAGARRSDRPLSLVIADIADFKTINDTYGHLEGDRCLREIGAAIEMTVRPGDSAFRWGGDEFAVILPATDAEQADAVVGRVAEAVAGFVVPPGDDPVRLRYGVAEIRQGMDSADLVAAADLALMSTTSAK